MDLFIEGKNILSFSQLKYIVIHVKMNTWGTKMLFTIDAGNDFNTKNQITDDNGTPVALNSEADLLNYLYACGYDFVNMYPMSKPSGEKLYKFIFKRIKD
jgi:hypothetical protein